MKFLKFIGFIFLIIFLTIFTQIGGVTLLISALILLFFRKKKLKGWVKVAIYVIPYLLATLIVVPLFAPLFGRQALPIFKKNNVQPRTMFTCLLNRNYVKPELYNVTLSVAEKMHQKYPETTINYMDANFPFFDGFPLLPHLSHSDGKKLDVALYYNTKKGKETNITPSFIGYGIFEAPKKPPQILQKRRLRTIWLLGLVFSVSMEKRVGV